ncbi:MAG: hypothetical protein QM726_08385 [Chitinophagaceae bacterium]
MDKQYYLPNKDTDKLSWLANLNSKLGNYAAKYGITNDELADVGNIYDDFMYRLHAVEKVTSYSKFWTAYKNALRDGINPGATVQAPAPLDFGRPPVAAEPGGFTRIAAIVKKIKSLKTYSDADGQDLQIVGTTTPVDFSTLTPKVSIQAGNAGMPEIVWNKQGMDGVAIYKDSGNGSGFTLYDLDNHPNWTDKHTLPTTATLWKYKLIYRLDDEEVGQWSVVLSINVGG